MAYSAEANEIGGHRVFAEIPNHELNFFRVYCFRTNQSQ